MPEIGAPVDLAGALHIEATYRYVLEETEAPPILTALPAHREPGDSVALLVGPEGGWTDREREQIGVSKWRPVSLGSQILRAETAAIAALAIVNAAWGCMTKADLYHFISKRKLGVLGYLSSQGAPRSALVGIAVTPELEIVFDTVSSSRKYRRSVANPAASFVIGWEGEVTVQYRRTCLPAHRRGPGRYQQIYFTAWPDGPERLSWPGLVHFVVSPRWIRYSDYDRRPPLIEEFTF